MYFDGPGKYSLTKFMKEFSNSNDLKNYILTYVILSNTRGISNHFLTYRTFHATLSIDGLLYRFIISLP